MASKYEAVLGGLAKQMPQDTKYQERVEVCKTELLQGGNRTVVETSLQPAVAIPLVNSPEPLSRRYRQLRMQISELDEFYSRLNLELEAVKQLMCDSYEGSGLCSMTLAGVDSKKTIRIDPEVCAQVKDKAAMRAWAIRSGYEEQLTLMPQTVASIAKERLLQGEDAPDGVEVTFRNKVVLS